MSRPADRPNVSGRSGDAPTWTTETLSISARRELLKQELRRLGLGKAQARESPPQQQQQQQQPQPPASPARGADADARDESAE